MNRTPEMKARSRFDILCQANGQQNARIQSTEIRFFRVLEATIVPVHPQVLQKILPSPFHPYGCWHCEETTKEKLPNSFAVP